MDEKRMITVGFENLVNVLDSPFTMNGKKVMVNREHWDALLKDYNDYLNGKLHKNDLSACEEDI